MTQHIRLQMWREKACEIWSYVVKSGRHGTLGGGGGGGGGGGAVADEAC